MEANFDINERLKVAVGINSNVEKLNIFSDIVDSLKAKQDYEYNLGTINRLADDINSFAIKNDVLNKKEIGRLKDEIRQISRLFERKEISSTELRNRMNDVMIKYSKNINFMTFDIRDMNDHGYDTFQTNKRAVQFIAICAIILILMVFLNYIKLHK